MDLQSVELYFGSKIDEFLSSVNFLKGFRGKLKAIEDDWALQIRNLRNPKNVEVLVSMTW